MPGPPPNGPGHPAEQKKRGDTVNQINKNWHLGVRQMKYIAMAAIMALLVAVFSAASPNFFSLATLGNLLLQTSTLLILSLGMTFVIITGNVDLSVGAQIAVCGTIGAYLMLLMPEGTGTAWTALVGFLGALGTGALFGAVNGVLIGYCSVSPYMTTLATMSLARGLALVICGDNHYAIRNDAFNYLAQGTIGPLPAVTVLLLVFCLFFHILLTRCKFGRQSLAVGGNKTASRIVGIDPARHVAKTYVLMGTLCGVGSVITAGRTLSAQPLSGQNLEFEVITAVVLGGTSLAGGSGTIGGTILGALLLGTITTGQSMVDVPVFINYLLKGFLILIAVYFDIVTRSVGTRVKKSPAAQKAAGGRAAHQSGENFRRVLELVRENRQSTLELRHISKYFPGVKALDDVSLTIKRGTVHALVGENGAGKSTLMKILSGVYQKDEGEIFVDGIPIEIKSPIDSQLLGISVIYQELALVPLLPVYNNIFLGKELRNRSRIFYNVKAMKQRAAQLLGNFGLTVDVSAETDRYTVGQRQMFEIAKAVGSNAFVVVMDEPTASITNADKETLFETIRELKQQGVSIIYISHRMQEIFEIADEVTVLRDGKHVVTAPIAEVNEDALIRYMVNRELSNIYDRAHLAWGETVLEVRNLTRRGAFADISFQLHAGEVLGFSGLIGAGRSEIMRCIFGLDRIDGGEVWLYGEKVHIRSPKDAIRRGIAFVTEDRRKEGIIPQMSVGSNMTLAILDQICHLGFVDASQDTIVGNTYVEQLGIKTPSLRQAIGNLSGGNQQKVCLGKWLATNPKIIILDEPTRGIDVGAKEEIHKIIHQLTEQNYAVILISSELPEIIGAADRIIVMYEGQLMHVYDNRQGGVTQDMLMTSASGIAVNE